MILASSPFMPAAWYWKAGDGRLYGSKGNALVPASDSAFAAWSAGGNVPTVWPQDDAGAQTNASLSAVLTGFGLPAFKG